MVFAMTAAREFIGMMMQHHRISRGFKEIPGHHTGNGLRGTTRDRVTVFDIMNDSINTNADFDRYAARIEAWTSEPEHAAHGAEVVRRLRNPEVRLGLCKSVSLSWLAA